MKISGKRVLRLLLALAVLTAGLGLTARAEEPVTYCAYDESTGDFYQASVSGVTVLRGDMTDWAGGWYVVREEVGFFEPVTLTGTVNVILCDGACLSVEDACVLGGGTLNVYAQSLDPYTCGELDIIGAYGEWEGKDGDAALTGDLNVYGGFVCLHGSEGDEGLAGDERPDTGDGGAGGRGGSGLTGDLAVYAGHVEVYGGDGGRGGDADPDGEYDDICAAGRGGDGGFGVDGNVTVYDSAAIHQGDVRVEGGSGGGTGEDADGYESGEDGRGGLDLSGTLTVGDALVVDTGDGTHIFPAEPVRFAITIDASSPYGEFTADREAAAAGEMVFLTVTPQEEYQTEDVIVYVESGSGTVDEISLSPQNGVFTGTFPMPGHPVTLTAAFSLSPADNPGVLPGPQTDVTIADDGRTAHAEGFDGLYARVALVLDNNGVSGLHIAQAPINPDGTIVIPSFMIPGLTVTAVNVALVPDAADVQTPMPTALASASWLAA